jgi:hypothetical protein
MRLCIIKLGKVIVQPDATMKFIHLNMFLASICPSPGVQSSWTVEKQLPQSAHNWWPSSIRPQLAIPVLHIICGSSLLCTPYDGHIDARNMLRWINFVVASSWIITLPRLALVCCLCPLRSTVVHMNRAECQAVVLNICWMNFGFSLKLYWENGSTEGLSNRQVDRQ